MTHNIRKTLAILAASYNRLPLLDLTITPFQTLIATLLSQRARDDQIIPVVKKLFAKADNPKDMLSIPQKRLEDALKPAGKYRQNAARIKAICRTLIDKFKGRVPDSEESLLSLPGVGRKTANILLSRSFGKAAIAVDTHVQRISNRLGWVKTRKPEETEKALQKIIPKKYWKIVNRVLVRHGQTICKPISPFCSKCQVRQHCKRKGVKRSR